MRLQWILPREGAVGTIREFPNCGQAIPVGSSVTVVNVEPGVPTVTVRDDSGALHQVGHWLVDCGELYEVSPGVWREPSDPYVLDWYEEQMKLYKRPVQPGTEAIREHCLAKAREMLLRHGRLKA